MTLPMSWDEWAQHDGTALAAYFDRLCGCRKFQRNIQAKILTSVELQGRDFVIGKAVDMGHQFIVPRLEIDEFKCSVAVRACIPLRVIVEVCERDLGVRDGPFGRILYHADDTAKRRLADNA